MIPLTVELTDFLSHRCADGDPVVFDFEGAVLWSVAGDNGAGKSAIFDAITWSLFGQHRGGSQQADKLICHGTDRCRAAFSFELGGMRYKVERSFRRRGQARRAAFKWDWLAESWEPIPDTTSEAGFKAWRQQLLGLSYEAFIHSVLLLQNGSDTLIRTGAKDRFDVLAQLIDLSAFQRLETLARSGYSAARAKRGSLADELEGLEPVTEEERQAAEAERERLETERDSSQRAVNTQAEVVAGARHFEQLSARLAEAEAKVAAAQELLADSERIEAQAAEADALAQFKTPLEFAVEALASAARAEHEAAAAQAALEAIDLTQLGEAASSAAKQAGRAKQAAAAAAAEAGRKAKPLPALDTLLARRVELEQAQELGASLGDPAALSEQIERCTADIQDLRKQVAGAARAEQGGGQQLAQAEALVSQLSEALSALEAGRNEPICSRCGQEVPEEHRQQHLAEARDALGAAEGRMDKAKADLGPLDAAHRQAQSRLDAKTQALTQLRLVHAQADSAQDAMQRAQVRLDKALADPTLKNNPGAGELTTASGNDLPSLIESLRKDLELAETHAEGLAEGTSAAEIVTADAARALQEATLREQSLRGSIETLATKAANDREHADTQLEFLEDSWAQRVRTGEAGLLDELEARLAELQPALEERRRLEQAQASLTDHTSHKSAIETLIQEVPLAHHVPLAQAELELEQRQGRMATAAGLLDEARDELRELDRRDQQREHKQQDLEQAVKEERIYRRMSTLLSRQGLQGQLLERSARALEVLGNETLTAVTGGNLRLEIRRRDHRGNDELSICAVDLSAGGERTEAAFLSGSEKFRVCVAMAAAIGKYASVGTSLDALVIDEGFGSLDEISRDQMIDELHGLAQLLERVIVVSHQGEFHDRTRFPHGYRLRRVEGATEVERYL